MAEKCSRCDAPVEQWYRESAHQLSLKDSVLCRGYGDYVILCEPCAGDLRNLWATFMDESETGGVCRKCECDDPLHMSRREG